MWLFLLFIGGFVCWGYYLLALTNRLASEHVFLPYAFKDNIVYLSRGRFALWFSLVIAFIGLVGFLVSGIHLISISALVSGSSAIYLMALFSMFVGCQQKAKLSELNNSFSIAEAFLLSLPILVVLVLLGLWRIYA